MRIAEWTDDLALGIDQIDADHANLLRIVRDIDAALASSTTPPDIHDRIVHLFRFADEHFNREDTLMDRLPQAKYQDHIDSHRRLHMAFLSRLAGLSNRTLDGSALHEQTAGTGALLAELVLEMVSVDRVMVDHLVAEGVI